MEIDSSLIEDVFKDALLNFGKKNNADATKVKICISNYPKIVYSHSICNGSFKLTKYAEIVDGNFMMRFTEPIVKPYLKTAFEKASIDFGINAEQLYFLIYTNSIDAKEIKYSIYTGTKKLADIGLSYII